MILRQALIKVCVLSFSVAACDAKLEDASSTKDQANAPEKDVASHESETFEGMQKPETMAERLQLRREIAARGARNGQVLDRKPADEAVAASGEVPDEIVEKIIKDLVTKIGADRADIDVLHAESLTWHDGSLGCGKPGQTYTQALVPGYRVILGHAAQQFDYRATEHGWFILCEQPTLPAPGAGSDPPAQ